MMMEARGRQQGWLGRPETAQLLLIVSDGRGINAEGLGVVRRAVRQAREANVFLVFIILDDPKNQVSDGSIQPSPPLYWSGDGTESQVKARR